ncbi:hypothetical protein SLA2020_158460 [Shorea laevis]
MVGPTKRHFLPFLILSLCILLLLYSQQRSSLLNPTSSGTITEYTQHVPTASAPASFSLTIKVLTFNRLHALSRCLRPLARAQYLPGNPVHLHVFIDHFVPSDDSNIDQKLQESKEILRFVDGFEWKWGQKMVHYRSNNAGLQAQWLEAWWPTSDNEFAFCNCTKPEVLLQFTSTLRIDLQSPEVILGVDTPMLKSAIIGATYRMKVKGA